MAILDEKLAIYIRKHPDLINFLNRLGIPLGFGNKTIKIICDEYGIDHYFFTELLQLIIKRYPLDSGNIHKFNIILTVKYLRSSHRHYLDFFLPDIEKMINILSESEPNRQKDCKVISYYFQAYKKEFINHLDNEDNYIFPYIIDLNAAAGISTKNDEMLDRINKNTIKNYIISHESLDEKLFDLKSLLIKHVKPFNNYFLISKLLKALFDLEEDLKIHELIENEILFQQALRIEDKLIGNGGL